jgi:nucleoside 2-deoxyribosyltransferase
MKVYLAGGFYSDWQDKVKNGAPQHEYFDPRVDADQRYPFKFIQQDLDGIQWCDVLLAYFEKSNPSGLGLALEIAWAVAFGKKVILVDEHERIPEMLAGCSRRIYTSLHSAIWYLQELE